MPDGYNTIQRTNNLFLLKNNNKFKTPVGFAHIAAISRVGLERQMSEAETKTKTKTKTEARPRLQNTCLETRFLLLCCYYEKKRQFYDVFIEGQVQPQCLLGSLHYKTVTAVALL